MRGNPDNSSRTSKQTSYHPSPAARPTFTDAYGNEVGVGDEIVVAMRNGNQADLTVYRIVEIGTYEAAWGPAARRPAAKARKLTENGRPALMFSDPSILKESLEKSMLLKKCEEPEPEVRGQRSMFEHTRVDL